MAAVQDAQPAAGEAAETTPKALKTRRGLIVGGAVAVVVLAAVGGGAYYYLSRDAATGTAADAAPAAPVHKVALYLTLKPDFIVNSTAVGQRRYLQTSLSVMTRDQAVIDALNAHAPIVRGALINLLADQDFMTLQTAEGKQALRDKMRSTIDATLTKEGGAAGIEAVLFNGFVMQ
jgi:flagellar FliL protein